MIPFLKRRYRKWPTTQTYALYVARTVRKREFVLQRHAIHTLQDTDRLQVVRCPVLGIVGDRLQVSIRSMTRSIAAIPGGRLEIVPNSLDPTNLCQSRIYNTLLRNFLREMDWE